MTKPPICFYIKHFGRFSTLRNSHFLNKVQLNFQTFSAVSFWMSYFEILRHPWCQNARFWDPAVAKTAPKITQIVPNECAAQLALALFGGPRTDLLPRPLSERSSKQFWLILGPPWHQNHGFLHDVSTHVDEGLYINSGHRFASSAVNAPNFR